MFLETAFGGEKRHIGFTGLDVPLKLMKGFWDEIPVLSHFTVTKPPLLETREALLLSKVHTETAQTGPIPK